MQDLEQTMTWQGLVYEGRQAGNLTPQKLEFARSAAEAKDLPAGSSLLAATQQLQPSALIGAAAKRGAFSADVIQALTQVQPSQPHVICCKSETPCAYWNAGGATSDCTVDNPRCSCQPVLVI